MIPIAEVEKHNSRESCWVVIDGNVFDVTEFLNRHPGGSNVILRRAGMDATEEYEQVHPPGTIESHLPKDKHLGPVIMYQDLKSAAALDTGEVKDKGAVPAVTPVGSILPLSACQSLEDLGQVARAVLSPKAAVYFDSGAESLSSLRQNRSDWNRITFRPRVLRNVSRIDMRCCIMGSESSLPIFIAPAAAARLGHKDGERCLTRGAARMDIPQCVCTYASVAPTDLMECFQSDPERRGGALFFQLYVPKMRNDAEKLIAMAKLSGFKALVVTVDSPVIGKRNDDDRFKALSAYNEGLVNEALPDQWVLPGQEAETLHGVHNSTLEWSDLAWIRQHWGDGPLIIKGIQTAEDALEAVRYGVDGIYLSNHGGRQLDHAPSPVQVLLEIKQRDPHIFTSTQVYVDGGVMRGTDVVKALCLGARAVGIGRGFLYALSAYGTKGVLRAISILSDEIQTTMRLIGVTSLAQLNDSYINLDHIGPSSTFPDKERSKI
ncbi:FMN-dependent dehydrogenase-domain-containing protein [Dactylonectria macrodidyma]|uniref:FMN-dependent dehydrogenase-domain-containing protein n=1 Tax=Dactylonectria macrodidyma TaxID=307937 RepID=A0A9P9EQR9_9HYPO|nr:FMN-dependent dehydrogenase-domain-containing protein [Dactylonectria macrodidyma]